MFKVVQNGRIVKFDLAPMSRHQQYNSSRVCLCALNTLTHANNNNHCTLLKCFLKEKSNTQLVFQNKMTTCLLSMEPKYCLGKQLGIK